MINRQASATVNGFLLQAYFGIFFIFHGKIYKEIKNIKIEGVEDIVITYQDGSKDYIQVKTHLKPNHNFDGTKFKEALITLKEASENAAKDQIKVRRLIYANNMRNQNIDKLNKMINNAENPSLAFISNFHDEFTNEETAKLRKYFDEEPWENFYISRIDERFFKEGEMLPCLSNFFDEMEIINFRETIYSKLKNIFMYNGKEQKKVIPMTDIAWICISKSFGISSKFNEFNNRFEDELSDIECFNIEDILEIPEDLINVIERCNDFLAIHQHMNKIKIKFMKESGERISQKNLKEFIKIASSEFKREGYLNIPPKCPEKDKEVIYLVFSYITFVKLNSTQKIYDEFNLSRM